MLKTKDVKENLKMSSANINQTLTLPMKNLKFTGVLQNSESNKKYRIYGWICHRVFIELFMILQLGFFVENQKLNDFAAMMSLFPSFVTLIAKIQNLMYKMDQFQELIIDIDEIVRKEFKNGIEMEKTTGRAYLVFKIFVSFGLLTSTAAAMNPILHHIWAFPMWLPFGLHKTNEIAFWIISLYQCLDSYICGTVNETLDMLPVFFMSYVDGMIRELAMRFGNIRKRKTLNSDGTINTEPLKDNTKELVECIKLHKKVIEINEKVRKIFSSIIMIQAVMSAIVLCTTIHTMTHVAFNGNVALFCELLVYMLVMILQIFLPCYYGNEIKLSSNKLAEEFFHTDWYFEDKRHKKIATIFMECTKKPTTLRAFHEFDIDLRIFTLTCNAAYTLFAVFRQK